jgi:hypothetical protein
MRYLLLLHVEEAGWDRLSPAEQEAGMAAYGQFSADLREAKALVDAGRLVGAARAKVVRRLRGERLVTDGPFAETKEQIGGFYLIEAADMDAALAWAERCPAAGHGAVEVRQEG